MNILPKFNQELIQKIFLLKEILIDIFPLELIHLITRFIVEYRCILEMIISRTSLCKTFRMLLLITNTCHIEFNKDGFEATCKSSNEEESEEESIVKKIDSSYCEKTNIIVELDLQEFITKLNSYKSSKIILSIHNNTRTLLEFSPKTKKKLKL